MRAHLAWILAAACALGVLCDPFPAQAGWCKGVTHVHTFWSDGNDFPESVFLRYMKAGYCIVVSSEHNKLATFDLLGALPTSDQWVSNGWVRSRPFLDGGPLSNYLDAAGTSRVTYDASGDGGTLVPSFSSTKTWIEALDAGFRLTAGMEITANTAGGLFVHMNVWALAAPITVQDGGANTATVLAVHSARARDAGVSAGSGVSAPLVTLNHPNWGDAAVTSDWEGLDIQFVEIVSGFDDASNRGASGVISVWRAWDQANWKRNVVSGLPYVWGVGSDDAHNYWGDQADGSCKQTSCGSTSLFRAWDVIRTDDTPTEAELLASLVAGDFYASTGVSLTTLTYGLDGSGRKCMTIVPAVATDQVWVYGITRAAGADGYGSTQPIVDTRGSVTSCPNPQVYAFARAQICNKDGACAWTQPMDL